MQNRPFLADFFPRTPSLFPQALDSSVIRHVFCNHATILCRSFFPQSLISSLVRSYDAIESFDRSPPTTSFWSDVSPHSTPLDPSLARASRDTYFFDLLGAYYWRIPDVAPTFLNTGQHDPFRPSDARGRQFFSFAAVLFSLYNSFPTFLLRHFTWPDEEMSPPRCEPASRRRGFERIQASLHPFLAPPSCL